jgi:tRNA(Ile)-lysidine synthase
MSERLEFETRLECAWPAERWRDVSLLVAVSGGADSVGLLRGLARLKSSGSGQLWVGHFNHALRGAESVGDEQFVAALADRLGLGCQIGRAVRGELENNSGDGLESAARGARYQFLQSAAGAVGARYVVTAHTADDQVETIVQRIFRGTGLGGLAGMRRARPLGPAATLIRPLLGIRREEIRAYLHEIGQPWREDSSNARLDATRNWLRHELLPGVERHVSPTAPAAILRLGQLAAESQAIVEQLAAALAERSLATSDARTLVCQCDLLVGQSRYVVREMFVRAWRERGWPEQSMGFVEWDALADMALAAETPDPYQRDFPGATRAQKKGVWLTLARLGS